MIGERVVDWITEVNRFSTEFRYEGIAPCPARIIYPKGLKRLKQSAWKKPAVLPMAKAD
jgi:hypothetical protein